MLSRTAIRAAVSARSALPHLHGASAGVSAFAPGLSKASLMVSGVSSRNFRASCALFEKITVPVPAMGEAVTSGDLVEWLKQPGDRVEMDEVICVIETDKVAVDIRSPAAGTLVAQLAKIEETVNTNQPIAEIDASDDAASSPKPKEATQPAPEKASEAAAEPAATGEVTTIPVPAMGEAVTQGDLVEWLKQPGDAVAVDEVICVIETDKVAVDIRSPVAGTLTKQLASVEETVHTNQPIAEIQQGAAPAKTSAGEPSKEAPQSEAAPAQDSGAKAHSDLHLAPLKPPMIHFRYGKRDVIDREMGLYETKEAAPAQTSSSAPAPPAAPKVSHTEVKAAPGLPKTIVEYVDLPASYGRLPPLSDEEALRIQLGGAEPY